jgi:hypothetical protein
MLNLLQGISIKDKLAMKQLDDIQQILRFIAMMLIFAIVLVVVWTIGIGAFVIRLMILCCVVYLAVYFVHRIS